MIAKVVECPACGEVSGSVTCTTCGGEPASRAGPQSRDEAASDRDETAESRDRAAERRDRGAEDRDARARHDEQAATERDKLTSGQDQAWSDDDQAASKRDQRAADADQRTADDDFAAGGDAQAYRQGVDAREESSRDRNSATASRHETTSARLSEQQNDGEGGRLEAADDREGAAHDREESARERVAALGDRQESAGAALQALETLESMSDAFFTLDSEWRFTYLNPQCDAILERRREDLVGTKLWEEFPAAVGSRFDDEYRRAVREQVPVRFEGEYTLTGRTLEVRAYPVTGGLAVYFSDVTEQHLRDARLGQTERLEMLGRLTAGVAHDFNNFLAVIGGYAGLGRAASHDEKLTGYFDQIDSASRKAVALTRQLLAFGREQDLAPIVIDLNHAVQSLSTLMCSLMPAGVELRLELAPQPVPVFVDRSQLEQVVLNLVVNARDAIETAGSITISSGTSDALEVVHELGAASGYLTVTDTGCGIPDDVRPHIFDPFFTTKPPEMATGLGLATIYGIVTQSGGSITVDSTVGVGTTFTVVLPAGPLPTP